MKGRIFISVILLLSAAYLSGQSTHPAGPPLFPAVEQWHEITVDPLQIEAMRSVPRVKDQPYTFAIAAEVSFNPENSGFLVRKAGETVWVLPVSSKDALSLNLILSPFNLPDGAYIYVYDAAGSVVRGAYTHESGSDNNTLPLMPLPGDRVILECHFPGVSIPEGAIGIRQVAHDFTGFFSPEETKDYYYGRSGPCEIDLNCSVNEDYLRNSRSVVRLLVAGTELCTGVLVNNAANRNKAYLLTANHCIESADHAANTIFLFNYKSPWCDGPDITSQQTLAGSRIRAVNPESDFTLVELNEFPPLLFRPLLAGWDISGTMPSSGYTLHHPQGDMMKLSVDNDPPEITSYPIAGFVENGFWRIRRWDMGSTEPGSSGGPLFDQNHRLRGTLTGGSATCANPANDYYSRLLKMFTIDSDSSANLRPWLDPSGSGVTITNPHDPYAGVLAAADTLGSYRPGDTAGPLPYPFPGWGVPTGNNSDSLVSYAEYIPFTGEGEIAWLRVHISVTSFLSAADSVRFFIWQGDASPGGVIASQKMHLSEMKSGMIAEIDFGHTVRVSGSFYAGYSVYYRSGLSEPQPQFAVVHSAPWPSPEQNSAWYHDGSLWRPFTSHTSSPMAVSLGINVVMVENSLVGIPKIPVNKGGGPLVFPNPFISSLSFAIADTAFTTVSLTIYDNSGRVVSAGRYRNIFPGVLTLELQRLPAGIYHYRLRADTDYFTGTLIKRDGQ